MLREVNTKYGCVRGLPAGDPRVTTFKGIPFAKPPVGDLRWMPPQECDSWEGTLEAYSFAPISVQDRPGVGDDLYCREWHVDSELKISEDSLYLNIWTPARSADEKLPVLVWFFGGGLQWGYPSEMEFDGERLARRGIIVVSVNYRLNVFGFMAHPDITKQSPEAPTNFGYLDQQAGTRWVYNNIAAFGGDPENITVAGQSAGGGSVMHQITNLENKGLIKKAIVMSGIIGSPYRESGFPPAMELEEAYSWSKGFLDKLGVKNIDEARKLDQDTILAGYNEYNAEHGRLFSIKDNCFVKGDPLELAMQGHILDIPIMAGNTADEFLNFILADDQQEYEKKVHDLFGVNDGDTFLQLAKEYDSAQSPSSQNRHGVVSGIELSDKLLFEAMKRNGSENDFYYYRFNADIPGEDNPGTFHSVDLWFFFETLAKCSRPYVGHHYDLARHMANYWVNFIKTGDPNGYDADGTPMQHWNPYRAFDCCEMEFTAHGCVSRTEETHELKAFLRGKMRDYLQLSNAKLAAYNPYLPSWEYVPDGEPYVFGDRVYVYGSHDYYNGDVFCMGDYVGWSAPVNDLGNWRYEGVIFSKWDEPLNPRGDGMLYAPDVTVGPDGKYYLFYVCSNVGNVSVAVCDKPAGRYKFIGHVHYEDGTILGSRAGDEPQFDPGVITEGEVTYLYTGFCGRGDKSRHGAMCITLAPDMLTIVKEPVFVVPGCEYSEGSGFEGHEYFEAASIRKKDNKYYFVYSSIVMHELCYAVSDRPDGGFEYGGVLISNCDLGIDSYKPGNVASAYGANNHGSIIEINNSWYVFYHRHTNGTWYSRQVCAEKLIEREDGGFKQSELTSCGLNDGPLPARGFYPAYIACNMLYPDGDDTIRTDNSAKLPDITKVKIVQEKSDGEECEAYVTNFNNGAVIGFKYFDFVNVSAIRLWMHGYARGQLYVKTELNGDAVGTVKINSNNIWDEYTVPVKIENGVHALFFAYEGSGNPHFKGFEFCTDYTPEV